MFDWFRLFSRGRTVRAEDANTYIVQINILECSQSPEGRKTVATAMAFYKPSSEKNLISRDFAEQNHFLVVDSVASNIEIVRLFWSCAHVGRYVYFTSFEVSSGQDFDVLFGGQTKDDDCLSGQPHPLDSAASAGKLTKRNSWKSVLKSPVRRLSFPRAWKRSTNKIPLEGDRKALESAESRGDDRPQISLPTGQGYSPARDQYTEPQQDFSLTINSVNHVHRHCCSRRTDRGTHLVLEDTANTSSGRVEPQASDEATLPSTQRNLDAISIPHCSPDVQTPTGIMLDNAIEQAETNPKFEPQGEVEDDPNFVDLTREVRQYSEAGEIRYRISSSELPTSATLPVYNEEAHVSLHNGNGPCTASDGDEVDAKAPSVTSSGLLESSGLTERLVPGNPPRSLTLERFLESQTEYPMREACSNDEGLRDDARQWEAEMGLQMPADRFQGGVSEENHAERCSAEDVHPSTFSDDYWSWDETMQQLYHVDEDGSIFWYKGLD